MLENVEKANNNDAFPFFCHLATRVGNRSSRYTTDQDLKNFAHTQIPDDPQHKPAIPFVEGTISYAGSGNNSRTSQLFISYGE